MNMKLVLLTALSVAVAAATVYAQPMGRDQSRNQVDNSEIQGMQPCVRGMGPGADLSGERQAPDPGAGQGQGRWVTEARGRRGGFGMGRGGQGQGYGFPEYPNFVDTTGDGRCDAFVDSDNDGICDHWRGPQYRGRRVRRPFQPDETPQETAGER